MNFTLSRCWLPRRFFQSGTTENLILLYRINISNKKGKHTRSARENYCEFRKSKVRKKENLCGWLFDTSPISSSNDCSLKCSNAYTLCQQRKQPLSRFLSLGSTDVSDWIRLCSGYCPVPCRMVSVPLASTDERPIVPSLLGQLKMSLNIAKCVLGGKSPPVKNCCMDY